MKRFYFLILFFFCLVAGVFAQHPLTTIHLKNGDLPTFGNLLNGKLPVETFAKIHYSGKKYALLQFSNLPGPAEKASLAAKGILLFDYLPGNAYMAEIQDSAAFKKLNALQVLAVYAIDSRFKISKKLKQDLNAGHLAADHLIAVTFYGTITRDDAASAFKAAGAQVIFTKIQPAHTVFIDAPSAVVEKIAELPFVTYISAQQVKPVPLNYNNRATHSMDALGVSAGRNLNGRNVTIGIGDDADPSTHVDFSGRLIVRTPAWKQNHGTHVTGTAAGAGILNPIYKGMAPQATIVSQYFSDILVNAPTYINDYHMVVTNNSYFSGANGCPGEGEYDVLSNYVDDQAANYNFLLHQFASGNDGGLNCSPFSGSFGTIKSGFQCGKNVLTVGAIDNSNYTVASFSSSGPVNDGRLKPEIVAGGVNIISTYPDNLYWPDQGTSMSSPTVAGAVTLLYERYRQLNGGADPTAALIKALVCNSAEDLGNPGPDYTFGFGMLNARTAVETMEKGQTFSGTINNGGSVPFTITGVPAGASQLKVMLYWADPAAAPYASTSLVNDLDLTVKGSDGLTHRPLLLNPNALHVNDPAAEGADHVNNIEQVVINTPPAGNFSVTINGTSIPSGPQDFVVVYQVIIPSVTIEYPFGGETLVPGETEHIRWSSAGSTANTFSLDYSRDHGATWVAINHTIPGTSRTFPWVVPDSASTQCLVRVTRNVAGYTDASDYDFSILRQPVLTVTAACQGYAGLLWNGIPSASGYQVMMLKGDSMQTIATTTDTTFLLSGLNRDSTYWLTVRGVNGTTPGRRAIASSIVPNSGPCTLAPKDFTVDSLISPVTGRAFSSSALGNNMNMLVELKNLGSIPSAGLFNMSYQVNGGPVQVEHSSTVIAPNAASNYLFTTPYDFSNPGSYTVKIWVDYPGDTLHANDTLTTVIRQLQNDPLVLSPSFSEGFETASAAVYTNKIAGLSGLDRCDFNLSNSNGRARTFINTGFARTGNRCVTLDQSLFSLSSTADSLVTTFNLSGYSATDQIWLDFYYKNHGIDFTLPGNRVWIRGNDQAAWIPVFVLPIQASSFGIYQSSGGIDVTGTLAAALPAQTVGSSFQVKFGEEGYTSANSLATDGNIDDGFSFDDITLTKSLNDAAVTALVSPSLTSCNLSSAETIQVKVKNYSSGILTNIAVSYSINGTTVTEMMPPLAARDSTIYSFTQKADLSAYQHYSISVWVTVSGDTYHVNDSLLNISLQTTPVIASFPYLEGFENNDGYWFTAGVNDSWAWGIPQKTVISSAANGKKAWVTNLTGSYNSNELSYLYSPCFDLSALAKPVLSFSHIFQTEDNCDCDYHWAEYSLDDVTWIKLGVAGLGTSWYDNSTTQAWQLSVPKWHVSSYDIPVTAAKVRFRIVMSSDPATTYEGVGIDDIHVFDKAAVYTGVNLDAGITHAVPATNNWVNFTMGANIVASINSNGQNLGNTTVKAFINTSGIRHTPVQYYLDRNLVITPANPPTDSVSVRFYFTDAEAANLINASGCPACTTIGDAYQSGVTQYSNAPLQEDSTLNDNTTGVYRYILPHSQVQVIPYDNGYYAEYKVAGFSEFWINNGGPAQNQPLPLLLDNFTAIKVNNSQALLTWSFSDATNLDRFVVQKSTDDISFADIGTVAANNDSAGNYTFTDNDLILGNNYYRLKMLDLDGNFRYSPVRNVVGDDSGFFIRIYPNPVSKGNLYISTSSNCNSIQLCDVSGRVISAMHTFGLHNTIPADKLSRGVYLVVVYTDSGKKIEKVVVE